jgi:hypothetical protein
MVHGTSGYRGTRVGVAQGSGTPRHQSDHGPGQQLPRIRVPYWCAKGHETRLVFLQATGRPDTQDVWDCPKCGTPATRDPGNARRRHGLTMDLQEHLDYVKERRSSQDAEESWLERWIGYAPAGSFRTNCWGTRDAAFSSMSHRSWTACRPRRGDLHGVGACQGQAHCSGLVLAGNHHPHFLGSVDGRQRQGDALGTAAWGSSADTHHSARFLADAGLLGEQRRYVRVRPHTEQENVKTRGMPGSSGRSSEVSAACSASAAALSSSA